MFCLGLNWIAVDSSREIGIGTCSEDNSSSTASHVSEIDLEADLESVVDGIFVGSFRFNTTIYSSWSGLSRVGIPRTEPCRIVAVKVFQMVIFFFAQSIGQRLFFPDIVWRKRGDDRPGSMGIRDPLSNKGEQSPHPTIITRVIKTKSKKNKKEFSPATLILLRTRKSINFMCLEADFNKL